MKTRERLIPAHAGKTVESQVSDLLREAHPRSRGENPKWLQTNFTRLGSSPLTRGKRAGTARGRAGFGLIPAHAGKTSKAGQRRSWVWAHPRSRGENVFEPLQATRRVGSSPLTRGKRHYPRYRHMAWGLIPAHAGKTRRCPRSIPCHRAHPRSRGENSNGEAGLMRRLGSSPLTRGKRRW